MTWVDITNLRGPQGEQGPVNVGLRQTDPITYAPSGGFTFNLADGSAQTVNIPLASAQSAGLQAPASAYDSGLREIKSLIDPSVWMDYSTSIRLMRSGKIVNLIASRFAPVAPGSGKFELVRLPIGFRPLDNLYGISSRSKATSVLTTGEVTVDSAGGSVDYLHFTFITRDAPPPTAPGTAV